MSEATFKQLSLENWREPDPAHRAFGEFNPQTGERRAMTAERWAETILAVELDDTVPREVREMWSVARGLLLYGWYFYPLYALGDEQLHRVADAAVLYAYRHRGGPEDPAAKTPPNLHRRLSWLMSHGHIDPALRVRWDAIRELRNLGSHASRITLLMPGNVVGSLHLLAGEIDALFAPAA